MDSVIVTHNPAVLFLFLQFIFRSLVGLLIVHEIKPKLCFLLCSDIVGFFLLTTDRLLLITGGLRRDQRVPMFRAFGSQKGTHTKKKKKKIKEKIFLILTGIKEQ